MNETELRKILQLKLAESHMRLSAQFTSEEYHQTLHAVNESIVKLEIDNWGRNHDELKWAKDFFRRFCVVREPSGKALMNSPMSIESILLDRATRTEIVLRNSISEETGSAIAGVARTDFDTFGLARDLVKDAAIKGPLLPASLHALAEKIAHGEQPPKKRGDTGWKLTNRNRIGIAILLVLTHENGFGMSAYGSRNANSISALNVLEFASTGFSWASFTASSADEIWRNRERLLQEFALLIYLTQHEVGKAFFPPGFALRAVSELQFSKSGRKEKYQHDETKS